MKVRNKAVLTRLALGLTLVVAPLAVVGAAGVSSAGAASKTTISVAYAVDTTFDTTPLAVKWWGALKKEFDAKYPQYNLKLDPISGGEPDFLTKLALQYHSSSTAPDVAQFPSTEISLYQSTGYLLNMSPYLKTSSWFSQYPTAIQNEGKIGGKIYAVSSGENNNALYYDKAILQKAGIALPWKPKNWNDILAAAKKIKASQPKVTPLWIDAGTSAGPNGAGYGALNLLAGSSNPTIQTASGKMVVSSSGSVADVQLPAPGLRRQAGRTDVGALQPQQRTQHPLGAVPQGNAGHRARGELPRRKLVQARGLPVLEAVLHGDGCGRYSQGRRHGLRVHVEWLGLRDLGDVQGPAGRHGPHQHDAGADEPD